MSNEQTDQKPEETTSGPYETIANLTGVAQTLGDTLKTTKKTWEQREEEREALDKAAREENQRRYEFAVKFDERRHADDVRRTDILAADAKARAEHMTRQSAAAERSADAWERIATVLEKFMAAAEADRRR